MPAIFIHKLLAFHVKSWVKHESGKISLLMDLDKKKKKKSFHHYL